MEDSISFKGRPSLDTPFSIILAIGESVCWHKAFAPFTSPCMMRDFTFSIKAVVFFDALLMVIYLSIMIYTDKSDKIAMGTITQPPFMIRSNNDIEGTLPAVVPVESAAVVVICRNK